MHRADSLQNSALLQYLHVAELTFLNLSYNTRMERTIIFLAALICPDISWLAEIPSYFTSIKTTWLPHEISFTLHNDQHEVSL